MTERDVRQDRWLTPNGAVVIPPRIAYWLETQAGITADLRVKLRLSDPVAYEVLMALHSVAMHYNGSADGTDEAETHRHATQSDQWVTTNQAAEQLGITDRGIRKRIALNKIPAELRGRQWFIHRNTIDAIRAAA